MRPARGFSLVEVTVVIGLIVLLAGLTLSAGTAVVRHAEHRTTATALTQLDAAVREWELQADRKLTWWQVGDGSSAYNASDVHSITPEVLIITEILDAVRANDSAGLILAQIDPDLVYQYRDDTAPWLNDPEKILVTNRFLGGLTCLDAWGRPIYATHPGRTWTTDDAEPPGYTWARDPDGTIRTLNEGLYGAAPNRRIVFVSAGPDGLFGLPAEFSPPTEEAIREARMDNIYSTPVDFEAYEH